MASFKYYRVVTTTPSAPYNIASGTTVAPTANATYLDKGVEVTFQNASTGAITIYIGGSDLQVTDITATSTASGTQGISLAQNATFQIGKRHSPTAIVMSDFYVISTSSKGICVAQLLKAV